MTKSNATRSLGKPFGWLIAFAVIYAGLALFVTNSYYQLILTLVLVWALLGLAWNILSGYSGLISFGHAAFFGLGAYTVTIAFATYDVSPWLGIPIGMMIGAVAGLIVGIPTFRLRGHYFALAMLAYPMSLLAIFQWAGYQEVALPMKRVNAALYMQFSDQRIFIFIALVMVVAALLLTWRIERSRFGMSLLAIKQNEAAAEAAGIDTFAWKLKAMMLSAALAAGAGGFYAVILLVVTPSSVFGMLTSAQAIIVTIFGGAGSMWGPIIGASVLIPFAEVLHAEFGDVVPGIQGVIYGLALVCIVIWMPEGLYWSIRDRYARRLTRAESEEKVENGTPPPTAIRVLERMPEISGKGPSPNGGEALLAVRNVSVGFGGLRALNEISFSIKGGEAIGIIGPNGAGKSTLFNMLNGFVRPIDGSVSFRGQELIGLRCNRVCRLGIGRTFQVVRAFRRLSVRDNVVVGAYVAAPTDVGAMQLAEAALAKVGISALADVPVDSLTSKELRLMELARALAPRPKLLLMDETLAGLGRMEIEDLLAVIQRVRRDDVTVIIIEHTMDALVRMSDRLIVLDHGSIISDGTPKDVMDDRRVIEAYLGQRWANRAVH
jgi:branched-chain amino acid transport system permease protein